MRKKQRITRIIICYTVAAFAVLSGFVYTGYKSAENYKRHIENGYQHAFSELASAVSGIDSALQKSLYATSSSMICSACTDVFGKSMAAQMAMGELPFAAYELEHTASFISKVGDYAYAVSKNAALGNVRTEDELENLRVLSDSASVLSQNLTNYLAEIQSGDLSISDIKSAERTLSKSEDDTVPTYLAESFKLMENEFPEIPALIYDGPFSEHITKMEPKLIENAEDISTNEAEKAAANFLGYDQADVKLISERKGSLPVMIIGASDEHGNDITVEVTRRGGHILYMKNTREVQDSYISPDDAVKIAKRFLDEHGFESMKESYYTVSGNTALINFAYVQDGVVCYSDLIKVAVALDNGSVTGFESLGYIMSHTDRDIPRASIEEADAKDKVMSDLKVISSGLAVIPTSGKNEIFCRELKCENSAGQHYIIYVNAETGIEEKILILLEDDHGTLTV